MLSFNFIRRATGITAAVLLLAAAGPSAASPAEEAEVLLRKGNELRMTGDDEGALPFFIRAHEVYRSPRTTAQLGLVESNLGRWVDVDDHLTEALKGVKTHLFIRQNRAVLEELLLTAKKNVGRVEITGEPVGAEVLVNGRGVGRVPLAQPIRVVAGTVDLEMRAPGHRAAFRTIAISGLQYQTVVIRLEKESEPSSPVASGGPQPVQRSDALIASGAAEPDVARSGKMATWRKAVIGTALGGAALGLGVGGWGMWHHNSQVDAFNKRRCLETANGAILAATRASDSRCAGYKSGFENAMTAAIVGLSAAGALGVTAIVLYLTDRTRAGGDKATAASTRSLACAPDLARPGLLCALPF